MASLCASGMWMRLCLRTWMSESGMEGSSLPLYHSAWGHPARSISSGPPRHAGSSAWGETHPVRRRVPNSRRIKQHKSENKCSHNHLNLLILLCTLLIHAALLNIFTVPGHAWRWIVLFKWLDIMKCKQVLCTIMQTVIWFGSISPKKLLASPASN